MIATPGQLARQALRLQRSGSETVCQVQVCPNHSYPIGCSSHPATLPLPARHVGGKVLDRERNGICGILSTPKRISSRSARFRSQLSYAPSQLVAVEGIEPTSLDYQSSALAVELHREVVDPTGLKPAPHGLKGRRSVTRAPGQ